MSNRPDVIVVGSGPAGVSTSFPLLDSCLRVLMLDGGSVPVQAPPGQDFLDWRRERDDQWHWMVGTDFQSLRNRDAVSPKLRVPSHRYVFDGFSDANRVTAVGTVAVGSLATGGLSQAWGCGVATLSHQELSSFPCSPDRIEASYAAVSRRIGLSGAIDDDLSAYFGVDAWSDPPVAADDLHAGLLSRYAARRALHHRHGFRLGRSRVAVLSRELGLRAACSLTGNCLYGCRTRALYSATEDLEALKRRPGFQHRTGRVVAIGIDGDGTAWADVEEAGRRHRLHARKLVLAAGTLASTRLALSALRLTGETRLESSPTAAFLLWRPQRLGRRPMDGFGLGQLSFVQDRGPVRAFGSLFTPTGIPLAEFVPRMPLGRRSGIDVLQAMMPSCLVGNLFLPGALSDLHVQVSPEGQMFVRGGHSDEMKAAMRGMEFSLRRAFWRTGWILLPGSFTLGAPGSDLHYGASLPMRATPGIGETDATGMPPGLPNVHVVDGACLPMISEKPHTLTIMANAHRIGEEIARTLSFDSPESVYQG